MVSAQRNDSFGSAAEINVELIVELRDRLTEASVKCSERCLYQSAKWYAIDKVPVTILTYLGQQSY